MLNGVSARIPPRFWALIALVIWGGLTLWLLRRDAYGLDEGAARALLLNWSVADNVVNPIVTFGVPDFRALIFVPLGIYWSGNILAAKVFTLLITFAAGALFYQWSCRTASKEVALIATGLLLIAPLTLMQIDALGVGPYLVLIFGLGVWLDWSYRSLPRPLGGKYFAQLVLVASAVSLHPAGLAYPLALVWTWHNDPLDTRSQRHIYIGVAVAVVLVALLRAGWHGLEWWANPLDALANVVMGPRLEEAGWLPGALVAFALLGVLVSSVRNLLSDLMGRVLALALIFGLPTADPAWALVVSALLLYYGVPRLIDLNETIGGAGFAGQRGGVMLLIFIAATWFMGVDRNYYGFVRSGVLPPQDQLILTLALEAADPKQPFRAASQWPGRTMIAVKRDVLPLPPPAKNGAALLKTIPGITHLIFDPADPDNKSLGRNIAELGGAMETLALQPGGVLIKVRSAKNVPQADKVSL